MFSFACIWKVLEFVQTVWIYKKNTLSFFFYIGLISRLYLFGTDQRSQFSILLVFLVIYLMSPFIAQFIFQTDKKEIIVLWLSLPHHPALVKPHNKLQSNNPIKLLLFFSFHSFKISKNMLHSWILTGLLRFFKVFVHYLVLIWTKFHHRYILVPFKLLFGNVSRTLRRMMNIYKNHQNLNL